MSDRILVLGADGFVGHRLTLSLLEQGAQPIAVSRRPFHNDLAGAEVVVADLNESSEVAQLLDKTHTVVYLASRSSPGTSAGKPVEELQNNLLPFLTLLQALQERPEVSLLYLSSGGSLYAGNMEKPAIEATTVQPRSYHGAAKVAAEYFIRAWSRQYNGHATVLRPSNLYGPGQTEKLGFGIVPTCFGKIRRRETLSVWGDGSNVRDYLYIDDFIELCLKVMRNPMPLGVQTFNASSGVGVSLNELFHAIEIVTHQPLLRTYAPSRTLDADYIVMDSTSARLHHSWTPKTSLLEGLKTTWDWFNTIQP
ncbi:MAG TPA: NAD-dependent epimerase/dehydratase family protein [Candidatus Saccharimonadales bacterium]|nr:NAD-dependent epimerase/dehydratase family protein [Candidatus Saccharimonadales bacterium]